MSFVSPTPMEVSQRPLCGLRGPRLQRGHRNGFQNVLKRHRLLHNHQHLSQYKRNRNFPPCMCISYCTASCCCSSARRVSMATRQRDRRDPQPPSLRIPDYVITTGPPTPSLSSPRRPSRASRAQPGPSRGGVVGVEGRP